MREEAYFLAPENVAARTGIKESLYKTKDGKYILSENDLRKVRFSMTPDEFVNGLDIEIISIAKAKELIGDGAALGGVETTGVNEVKEKEEE